VGSLASKGRHLDGKGAGRSRCFHSNTESKRERGRGCRGNPYNILLERACDPWFTFSPTSFLSFYFLLFRAALAAYGCSQARGPIKATVTSLHHSSWQCQSLNPLSKARNRTCNLMVPSQIHFHCTTMGTPSPAILKE